MGAVLDLVRVLFEPTAVFERLRERPKFLPPYLALAAVQLVIGFLQLPYMRAALAVQVAAMPQANPQAAETAQKFAAVGVVLGAIAIALILVINAGILWVLVSVIGGEAKFASLLSVSTYAFTTGILLQIAGLAVLMLKGTDAITGVEDLQPALGLDLLVPGAKGFTLAVLRGINPFSLWGVYLTATGITVTQRTSQRTGWIVAAIGLLLGLVIAGAFAGLRRG
jgi:hypothetical protein